MALVDVKALLEAGVHYGHRASRWNPKMRPYIYGKRNLIHIIDLRETVRGLLRAYKYLSQVVARGGLVMPGFDDAHIHLRSGARQLADAQLFGLETPGQVSAAIRAHDAATAGRGWLLGRGWMYAVFPGGLPTRGQLDAIVPDRPAFLTCYDGHTAWANSAALRVAGIDRTTPEQRRDALSKLRPQPVLGAPT